MENLHPQRRYEHLRTPVSVVAVCVVLEPSKGYFRSYSAKLWLFFLCFCFSRKPSHNPIYRISRGKLIETWARDIFLS